MHSLHLQADEYVVLILKMEAVRSSETSVSFYSITAQKTAPFKSIFTWTF
jgi:hypothetical protein